MKAFNLKATKKYVAFLLSMIVIGSWTVSTVFASEVRTDDEIYEGVKSYINLNAKDKDVLIQRLYQEKTSRNKSITRFKLTSKADAIQEEQLKDNVERINKEENYILILL